MNQPQNSLQNPLLVDSKTRELQPQEIMLIGAQVGGTAQGLSASQVYAAVTAELQSGHALGIQFGNTLFILDRDESEPSAAFFRALNADIAPNYVENCKQFIGLVQQNGYKTLVTQFQDPNIARLLQLVKDTGAGYYLPTTRMEILQKDGLYQASIFADESQYDSAKASEDPGFNRPPRGKSPLPPPVGQVI